VESALAHQFQPASGSIPHFVPVSRCLLSLSVALLLADCGSSSTRDEATTIPNVEPTRAVAQVVDDVPTLTTDELAAAAAFYSQKIVSIIVGSGAGGGFDI